VAERDVPTKTIAGPDGRPIHYPDLPNVGEPYRKPDLAGHNEPAQHTATTPIQASATPIASESWRERVMSAARSAVERAGTYGQAAVNALVLDDWKALTSSQSTPVQRLEAVADLASWAIPEGKVAEIAGHAVAKATELAATHLAALGFEHAGAAAAAIAASRGLSRPLTEAERSGHFQSAGDFKKFMGPATEHGGPERDWHHIVEKNHADGTDQFTADQIHSVKNVVPVPRDVHRGAGGLSAEFNAKDEFLGTSLRERLQGQPWEDHVVAGQRALRRQGLDPDVLRAETQARFGQRLLEHDRVHAISQERGSLQIATPGLLLGSAGVPTQQLGHEPVSAPRSNRTMQWSPDMPFEDFAKMQAHIRGGSQRETPALHYERDGLETRLPLGGRLEGTIQRVDGDRIVQHIGRGHTAMWLREELASHFNDPKAFDAMMQPGNYVKVGVGNNGTVNAQQRLSDHSWHSLNGQPTPSLDHGHGR